MQKIYNELRRHEGKLTEFSNHLVEQGIYSSVRTANQALRFGTKYKENDIRELYEKWKHGKFKTKDVEKYNTKVANVFRDIKRRDIKEELVSIHEVLEESLMELTVAIKKNDKEKLTEVKEMLQNALYGSVA